MSTRKIVASTLALAFVAAMALAAGILDSNVDSTGPNFTRRYIVLPLQGQFTTDLTGVVKFEVPQDWKILAIQAECGTRAGSAGDAKWDVTVDGVSALSAKISCDASGTIYSGTLTSTPLRVDAGDVISVNWDRTSSGTCDNATITISYRTLVASE